ncbi:unnamed protein product [Polarella glacialis]|uniref:RING-type domain-containing protein n=1 Tax=Polarella glacialis TaxID=89957 RepID=A0A813GCZ9_POLGL|nr:unnamed protein product [Polarella glacialis]
MEPASAFVASDADRRLPRALAENAASGIVVQVLIGAFVATILCALSCVGLNLLQARRRAAAAAGHPAQALQAVDDSAPGKGRLAGADHFDGAQVFEVLRMSSTVFRVQALEEAAATANEVQPASIELGAGSPEACEICCDAAATVVYLPCAHGGLCEACAAETLRRSNLHCVHCRGPVGQVLLVESALRLQRGLVSRAQALTGPPQQSDVLSVSGAGSVQASSVIVVAHASPRSL